MRFASRKTGGYRAFAVAGIHTVSFAIDAADADTEGLLGFAVERIDPFENERYFMPGFKVFPTVHANPQPELFVSTFEHPVQSFVWDDFTAKPAREYEYLFYPVKGTPRNLEREAPMRLKVRTEPLYSRQAHDVFFNRGVASSQAYQRRFGNTPIDRLEPAKALEAREWLSRHLDEALLKFIGQAKSGDTLLCCFYEFRYRPVADALAAAIKRSVTVQIIVDAKVNERTDKDGKFYPSFPREDNLKMIKDARIPKKAIVLREANAGDIQHNKFMVLLKGVESKPSEVWTGSTNMSDGGVFGQTNVGHWLRDAAVAERFQAYWEVLARDPGSADGDDRATARKRKAEFRQQVEDLFDVPADIADIPSGVTPVFSPRRGLQVLDTYVAMVDGAEALSCITLAFGINAVFKEQLRDNTPQSHMTMLLLEKQDRPNARSTKPYVAINAANNVYKAWGAYIKDPVYRFARETNARGLGLNKHVAYIHSKFLLMDPLSDDPIVVTGSANFSAPSTNDNDENMLVIRGDRRSADIYFTEFNRLFNHYYFRSVMESLRDADRPQSGQSVFLREDDTWLAKYEPGSLRWKRVQILARMKGYET